MNLALVTTDAGMLHGFTPEADALKEELLSEQALTATVSTDVVRDSAQATVQKIHDLLCDVETFRKKENEPDLRRIQERNRIINAWREELEKEETRLNTEIGSYQQVQALKYKDALLAHSRSLTPLEQKREEALSKCNTDEERDLVSMDFNQQVQDLQSQAPKPNVAPGQNVKMEWVIEDQTQQELLQLANANLALVNILPRKTEIKAALDMMQAAGVTNPTLPGVRAEKRAVNKNRKSREAKAIEV